MSSDRQLSGWAKPDGAHSYHFFLGYDCEVLLEAVCWRNGSDPWFSPADAPLVQRDVHADGNCLGCRAWLSLPRNRRQIEVVEVFG